MKGCDGSRQAQEGSEPTEERMWKRPQSTASETPPNLEGLGTPQKEGYFVRQG